jgi:hypothetical protein
MGKYECDQAGLEVDFVFTRRSELPLAIEWRSSAAELSVGPVAGPIRHLEGVRRWPAP